jgi:hypothetical protein
VKKVISISMVVLVLTAMLNLTVATHYCGGEVAASKISLSGKLASCGMETDGESKPSEGLQLKSHCCDDVVTTCSIDNNYAPSYSFLPDTNNSGPQVISFPAYPACNYIAVLTFLYADVSPPGYMMSTTVDLSDICVFRI